MYVFDRCLLSSFWHVCNSRSIAIFVSPLADSLVDRFHRLRCPCNPIYSVVLFLVLCPHAYHWHFLHSGRVLGWGQNTVVCLSKLGHCHRTPVKVTVCVSFAVPLVSCILRMAHAVNKHGPRDNPCPGSNKPPFSVSQNSPYRQPNNSHQYRQALSPSFTYSPVCVLSSLLAGHLPVRHSLFGSKLGFSTGFTLRRVLAVFMRSAITTPKVNRFGWNLEHSEYIVGGWQILGAIQWIYWIYYPVIGRKY